MEIQILDRTATQEALKTIVATLENFIKNYEKAPKKMLGIISRSELLDELNISIGTIKEWEKQGLQRYEPPIEGTRSIFYKISDVMYFLGIE